MSQPEVYQETKAYLAQYLRDPKGDQTVGEWVLDRLTLLSLGIITAESAAPAKIAQAGQTLSGRGTQAESVERRLRRIVRDKRLDAASCYHPIVKAILRGSGLEHITLVVDPSLQEDRVVMVSIHAWYRGRSLPLVWTTWPANQPLEGEGFWQRIDALLSDVARLLPVGVTVTVLADRAFGSPAFTDLVAKRGWHWVVRVQGQTRCRDRCGRERPVADLIGGKGQRRKMRGSVFKKTGWREASVVVYWGRRHRSPLCLVSDLPPDWDIIDWYRHRFSIEPTFRDYKAYGWHWEQIQVKQLAHLDVLLVGMALATCLSLLVGALQAAAYLARPPSGKRHTRPWPAKYSLFQLGLRLWHDCLAEGFLPQLWSALPDWEAPNWSTQITAHHVHAFIFS
ncbi:MAG: IS4/IS5 family transposase [Chloroflexi bacterium]|nr:MAG: IS4/IS5 family transposase [Chloroflexota bacterium]